MLTRQLAREIVHQTMNRLNRNINIMNDKGIIIASGDPERIDQIHEGALEVLRSGQPVIITENHLNLWKGSLPGINLPIQFQDQIIGVIGITGNPKEIMEFGELAKMITEMMINQAFLAAQVEWKQRLKELIFEDLVKGAPDNESVEQRLSLLNIRLEPPYQVGVVEFSGESPVQRELSRSVEAIFHDHHVLVGFLSVNRLFILTSGIADEMFKRKLIDVMALFSRLNHSFRIGTGTSAMERREIRSSVEEAKNSLLYGSREHKLTAYEEVEAQAMLHRIDNRFKHQYAERILKQLSGKLIETLEHFFANNQNIGETAKRMYIHRNSLIYRLKKIKEDTGYDPQLFQDAVCLQMAVWIHSMRNHEETEGSHQI